MRQTPNQFHYSQINCNISGVCLTAKEKIFLFFFALTNILFVSRRWQHFALSSLPISSKAVTLYSLLLGYLLEGGNTLLSPPWLFP